MKKLFIYLSLITLVVSCSKEFSSDEYGGYEMMTDYMLKEYTQGAALRGVSVTGEFQAATPNTSVVNWTLEPHDNQMGGLTESVDMFIAFNSGSELLLRSWNRSDMYDGPVGLPRFDTSLSLNEALSALGQNSFRGNDVVNVRFVLNLTDGRSISRSAVTGSMTGSYFRSPFLYPLIIGCRFDANNTSAVAGIYTINAQDSYGDGWNGATLEITVDGVLSVFTFTDGYDYSEKFTVPESAQTVGIAFTSGTYDDEITYSIEWTDLNGGNGQTAITDGVEPAVGFKSLNICQ
ncbi:MAG: hypothetical protein ACJ0OM_01240 [Candidatus Marisimplicoccus sp.]